MPCQIDSQVSQTKVDLEKAYQDLFVLYKASEKYKDHLRRIFKEKTQLFKNKLKAITGWDFIMLDADGEGQHWRLKHEWMQESDVIELKNVTSQGFKIGDTPFWHDSINLKAFRHQKNAFQSLPLLLAEVTEYLFDTKNSASFQFMH